MEAHAAAVAKKNGFAGLDQYDDVSMNIMMIMSGIDPQTKKFTDAPELIKDEIAALKADKSAPEGEKKEGLAAVLRMASKLSDCSPIAAMLNPMLKTIPQTDQPPLRSHCSEDQRNKCR